MATGTMIPTPMDGEALDLLEQLQVALKPVFKQYRIRTAIVFGSLARHGGGGSTRGADPVGSGSSRPCLFAVQQCGEKAVKAIWYALGEDLWGHSIQKYPRRTPQAHPSSRARCV